MLPAVALRMSVSVAFMAGVFGVLAGLAYAVLALLIAIDRIRPPSRFLSLVTAAIVVAAACGLITALRGPIVARPAALVEVLLWTVLLALAGRIFRDRAAQIVAGLALVLTVAIALVAPADRWLMAMAATSIIGLFLVTGLAGSTLTGAATGRRLLLLALGAGFSFDIALAALALADAALLTQVEAVRPLLRGLLVPLLALGLVTLPRPDSALVLSPSLRRLGVVVTCTAFAVLVAAATAAVLGRYAGAMLGLALFLPATLAILAAALTPATWAWLGDRLGRYLRPHRYDYREIWPSFVDILTGADPTISDDLPERVIRAVAGTVDATGGAIWINEGEDRFRRLAVLGLPPAACGSGSAPGLAAALLAGEAPGEPDESSSLMAALNATSGPLPAGLAWPSFLPPQPTVWLVLPLVHKETLFGFLVLGNPRQRRPLDQEDRELLRLVARQATSYLAEDEAARQLANARQFESFTRRFAYVMHDVKNVAAELALTHANAKKHRGNPAFYDDMLETLAFSVARMNRLIDQLRRERDPRLARFALAPLLRRVAGRRADPRLTVVEPLAELAARVEAEALETALEHLVDNALEAVGETGKVRLALERQGRMAALTVADDGPGLPPEVMHHAGRAVAFASSKPGGLGLGLDQARHTVERVGGRFDLVSSAGQGTTITLCLPELPAQPGPSSLEDQRP